MLTVASHLQSNHGILAMLDDECMRTHVSDDNFLHKVTQTCQDNPYFESHGCKSLVPHTFLGPAELQCSADDPAVLPVPFASFRIRHFAGTVSDATHLLSYALRWCAAITAVTADTTPAHDASPLLQVTYCALGFVEKNNDLLYRELSSAMYQSDNELLKALFPEGNPKRATLKRPATIATQFKISVGALLKNIQSKQLNFVKCIKPNELKAPQMFEVGLVQHQVRYLLLTEMAKLRRTGFAFRQDYDSFLHRYKMTSPVTWPSWHRSLSAIEGVTHLLKDLPLFMPEFAFGRTKLFVRSLRTVSKCDALATAVYANSSNMARISAAANKCCAITRARIFAISFAPHHTP